MARVPMPTLAYPDWVVSMGLLPATPHSRRDHLPRPGCSAGWWSLMKVSAPPHRASSEQTARRLLQSRSEYLQGQAPIPVFEPPHGGIMISTCIHREFPLFQLLLLPLTVSLCTFEKPRLHLPCTLPFGLG